MNSWSRDPGFYHAPVVKSLLVLTSASSVLSNVAILKSYPAALLVVRVWSLPSLGVWLTAALIFYQCRLVEKRRGSTSFLNYLFLSGVSSCILLSLLLLTRDLTGLPISLASSTAVHALIGALTLEYITMVTPAHPSLAGLPLSSNTPLYLLAAMLSATSLNSAVTTVTGLLGALTIRGLGLSLPPPPSWISSFFRRLVGGDHTPHVYTGATLSVQAQQRTDEMERIMANMYTRRQQQNRRLIVIGRPHPQALPPPSEEQIAQLLAMGFSRQESVQALQHTGSNIEAAIQLLTIARQQN